MNLLAATVVITASLFAAALILAYPRLRRAWRAPARLSTSQRRLLAQRLPWFRLLDRRQRDALCDLSARMLADVVFVGCGGVVVTQRMKLLVAGQAGLLCLGPRSVGFSLPGEILIYPDAFYIPGDRPDENGLVSVRPRPASGEAWRHGRVVLSWRDIESALDGAGSNVVLHEFAHLLDFALREAGAPPMAGYDRWSAVFGAAYDGLRTQGSPVIDSYGMNSPTEFFAVAVEAFFQRGDDLAAAHGDLYRTMVDYFNIDTARHAPCFRGV